MAPLWIVQLFFTFTLLTTVAIATRVFPFVGDTMTAKLSINLDTPLYVTDDRFLSLGMDSNLIRDRWETFDFNSVRLQTLAKGLTPAYMRLMGTDGDRMIFVRDDLGGKLKSTGKVGDWPFPASSFNMTSSDWDAINKWTALVGWRLLFGINAQTRRPYSHGNGTFWDASNALELLDYSVEKGYASNLDFEFGNEPDLWKGNKGMLYVPPRDLAKDFIIFKNLLQAFYSPHFDNSLLVGPDVGGTGNDGWIKDFLDGCGGILNATTFHQYYGGGEIKNLSQYIDPKILDIYKLQVMEFTRNVKSSNFPTIKMWNGETSSTYSPPGNEPDLWKSHKGMVYVSPKDLGNDFIIFKKLLHVFYSPHFENSMLIGPDVAGEGDGLMKDFLDVCGEILNATTFHHYYGGSSLKNVADYIDPKRLDSYKNRVVGFINNVISSAFPGIAMWNGETSSTGSPPSNEPNIWFTKRGFTPVPPEQLAKEFHIFRLLINNFYGQHFAKSLLVGPDVTKVGVGYMKRFLDTWGSSINATTFHQYYGRGENFKTIDTYLNASTLDEYGDLVREISKAVRTSKNRNISIWQGETSSTVSPPGNGIDETYVAGFMLLDKLGLSARLGLSLVVRQTFYGFWFALVDKQLEPRPNYWLALMFKRLVGREVLGATVNVTDSSNDPASLRIYAHCTSERSGYAQGSVVIYAMNLFNETVNIKLADHLASGSAHKFLWTAPNGNLTSENILLNGQPVKMLSDKELPSFEPVIDKASNGVIMPKYSMAYYVLPDIKVKQCVNKI